MGSISISIIKDSAWIKLAGRGTFQNSHPIKQWFTKKMGEGHHNLCLDLSQCMSMDSTFMGMITGLSLKLKKNGHKPLRLNNVTKRNVDLLETLGLSRFMIFSEIDEAECPSSWDILQVDAVDKINMTKHMVDAHQKLINAGDASKGEFKGVYDLLKKDLERQKKRDNEKK